MRIVVPLLLGLTLPATGQDSKLKGKPFSIHLHFRNDAMARQASRLCAATWTLALARLRPDDDALERAVFQVHVYRDADAYHAAGERARSPFHKDAPAFADARSRTCHMLIEPDDTTPGLPMLAQRVLAHECMHLAIYASNPGSMFLPEWFAEGLPLWAEAQVVQQQLGLPAVDDVVSETHYNQMAKDLIARGTFPTVQQILAGELPALDRLQRYVVFGRWCRHLAGRGNLWQRLWTISLGMPGPAVGDRLRDLVAADAKGGLPALDAEFRAYVGGLEGASLARNTATPSDARGKVGDAAFVPASPRVQWFDRHGSRDLEIGAGVVLRAGAAPQADVVFDRGGERWLRVTLYGGDGVRVSERAANGAWQLLGACVVPADVPVDQPVAIRIVARAGKLDVEVAKKRVLSLTLDGLDIRGNWGLGGPEAARVAWSDVRVR